MAIKEEDLAPEEAVCGAFVSRTKSTQSIPNSTPTAVSFDTVVRNDGGIYDTTSPDRFTIAIAGWYIISGSVYWDSNTVGTRQLFIYASSGTTAALTICPASAMLVQNVSGICYLPAGVTVQLMANQNSGASRSIQYCYAFSMAKVGI